MSTTDKDSNVTPISESAFQDMVAKGEVVEGGPSPTYTVEDARRDLVEVKTFLEQPLPGDKTLQALIELPLAMAQRQQATHDAIASIAEKLT